MAANPLTRRTLRALIGSALVLGLISAIALPAGAGHGPALRPLGPALPRPARPGIPESLRRAGNPRVRFDPTPGRQVSDAATGIMTTFAGGSADGSTGVQSTFKQPYDAFADPDGSIVVVDTYSNRVRRIDGSTGLVSAVAGTGDAGVSGDGGPAAGASLNFPLGAARGPDGSLYIADTWNDRIRKVDQATGDISTVAGMGPNDAIDGVCYTGDAIPATSARLCEPHGIAIAPNGDLFIADTGNNRIRRMDAATGMITTVAGNGLAGITRDGVDPLTTYVNHPWGIVVDEHGNPVFTTADYRIRYVNTLADPVTLYPGGPAAVTVAPNTIATIGGDGVYSLVGTEGNGGPATAAAIGFAQALHQAAHGDLLLGQDGAAWDGTRWYYAMRVRRISWRTGIIHAVAGSAAWGRGPDGIKATHSALSYPEAAFSLPDGDVGVVDRGNSRIRLVDHRTGRVTSVGGHRLGDGLPSASGRLDQPWGLASGASGSYFSDGRDLRVRRVLPNGTMTTAVGSGRDCVLFGVGYDGLCESLSGDGGRATRAHIFSPTGMDLSAQGLLAMSMYGEMRVVNETSHTVTLYPASPDPIELAAGRMDVVAGGGDTALSAIQAVDARSARIGGTYDISWTSDGDMLLAETFNCRIDRIDGQTGLISVLAGQPCDQRTPNYLDGPAQVARFFAPYSVAEGPDGNVYVADTGNQVIREIDVSTGLVSTVAGTALVAGFSGDGGPANQAEFAYPVSVSFAPEGSMIVADALNDRIRRIAPDATRTITTIAGSGPSYANSLCGSSVPCGHFGGDGGPATSALLYQPMDAVVTQSGLLLIADQYNDRIRAVQTDLRR